MKSTSKLTKVHYGERFAEELLTLQETARYLKVDPRTVFRMIHRGELSAVKVGRLWRIRRFWLKHWLERQTRHSEDVRVAELKERVLAAGRNRICRVVLYGSRARGTARPDSDLDLLVVEEDPVSKPEERERLRRAIGNFSIPIDIRVMGETEFEETKNIIGGIAYPAHREGILLYEAA
jgi:excisionase family DNA binding protein